MTGSTKLGLQFDFSEFFPLLKTGLSRFWAILQVWRKVMVSMESLGIFAKLLETTGNAVIRNIKIRCRCQSFLYFDLSHCFLDDFLLAEAV